MVSKNPYFVSMYFHAFNIPLFEMGESFEIYFRVIDIISQNCQNMTQVSCNMFYLKGGFDRPYDLKALPINPCI